MVDTIEYADFTAGVQLIGSIVLVVVTFVVAVLNIRKGVPNAAQKTKSGSYELRPRLLLWLRQLSLAAFTGLFAYSFLHDVIEARHAYDAESSTPNGPAYYAARIVYLFALFGTMNADGINNLANQDARMSWLCVYATSCALSAINYALTQTDTLLSLFLLSVLTLALGVVCAFVNVSYEQVNPPTAEYTCGLFNYWTFKHLNSVLILPGMKKKSFEFETDVPHLSDADAMHEIWKLFRVILLSQKELNLWYSIFRLVKYEWLAQGFFQFMGSSSTYITPLALERILLHIANNGSDDDEIKSIIPISIELAVVMLFVGPLMSCIGDNQNYVRGRHIGIRIRGALIASIYNKALSVDLSASKESIGKINNLISVDVGDIQTFCCYSHMLWSALLEIVLSSTLLYIVLGQAAFGGFAIMLVSLGLGLLVSKLVEHFQEQLLHCKDGRMGIVNEVLNSMRVIKYYAWENKFAAKINEARRKELGKLRNYAVTDALLFTFWEIVPAVVGAAAFVLHTFYLGKPLTPSMGFTALTLFNLLRFPLDYFPDMLNFLVRTRVSLRRIESFLRTPDVKGISDSDSNGDGNGERNGNNGYLHTDLSRKAYTENVFAPKSYQPYTRVLDSSHADTSVSEDPSVIPSLYNTVGCIELKNLTLAWAPTLKEEEEKYAKHTKTDFTLCCARRVNHTPSTTTSSTVSALHNNATSSQYDALTSAEDDEDGDFSAREANLLQQLAQRAQTAQSSHNTAYSAVDSSEHGIALTNADTWTNDKKDTENAVAPTVILQNTSFSIPRGALAVVVGVTGSGKSSLLQGALLGEGVHLNGSCTVGGSISYVSQSPWIQNATLRENVLFGTPYDKERYDKVVYSCALLSDFKLLPAGDSTEIGEKGVNLSGGQQQRVSLARAAYAYSDVILLDDPLSAVDALVGEHIFKELVLGFLKDRTRVLVTHNMALCVSSADLVICINSLPSSNNTNNQNSPQNSPQNSNGHGRGQDGASSRDSSVASLASSGTSSTSSSTAARSEVVACCPPTQLSGVIERLRVKAGASSDLSVFLEGLVAAAALVSKGTSSKENHNTSTTSINAAESFAKKSEMNGSTEAPSGAYSLAAPFSSDSQDITSPDMVDESPRTMSLRRQNFSYESLRKGITTVNATLDMNEIANPTHDGVPLEDSAVFEHSYASNESAVNNPVVHYGHAQASPSLQNSLLSGTNGFHVESAEQLTINAGNTNDDGTTTTAATASSNITVVEGKSVGIVGWGVYWFYFKACGGVRACVGIVMGTALTSLAWLFQNIALGQWMDAMEHHGLQQSERTFDVYMFSVSAVLLATLFRAFTQVTSNLISAYCLHDRLITSVMSAPCGWFDATPVGRIVNRFSQDISTVDSSIIKNMYGFVDRLLATVQIISIICISLPLLLFPLMPVVFFTWWVARQYLHVSRELKRLESLKKSPVFVLFSETLQGLPIVRSFRAEGRFFRMCCDRINDMNRCHLYLWISNRWLSFRMQILGALTAGAVGLAVVLEADRIGSTVAGIVLIYSLSFCEALTFLARSHADCQMDLNSIERLQEYSDLPTEKGLARSDSNNNSGSMLSTLYTLLLGGAEDSKGNDEADSEAILDTSSHPLMHEASPHSANNAVRSNILHPLDDILGTTALSTSVGAWPTEGCVEFKNITLQYNSNANPVLRDVSFTVPGRTKLGVVGRTGAGKSSLIAALFRIVEPSGGELLIDGVNVLNMSLHTLRNNVAIVPQDPTLFRGSVRFNLDPFSQHTDDELWAALTSAHLAEHISNMPDSTSNNSSSGNGDDRRSNNNDSRRQTNGAEENSRPSNQTDSDSTSSSGNRHGHAAPNSNNASYRGSLANKQVAEKGANFSLGQRQLLCMARAILRKASVLVLDECTASVDHETDALIQETVRRELGHCTVICIAHRLHTIAYYDNVLVMDQGRKAEFAPPFELIQQENSLFRQMCVTSGDYEELYATAEDAYKQSRRA